MHVLMKNNSNIPIENIYYMLAYAFNVIDLDEYTNIDTDKFSNVKDLYIEILRIGVPPLIKRELKRDYINSWDISSSIKGKIDITNSIKNNTLKNRKLYLIHDEFSEDILVNQIIKSTIMNIMKYPNIPLTTRKVFNDTLYTLKEVRTIRVNKSCWETLNLSKYSLRYNFILNVCKNLYLNLIFSEIKGNDLSITINDEQRISSLFEKFIFNFYSRESSYKVSHPVIYWDTDNGYNEGLPIMQTDLLLTSKRNHLIIDTKFYNQNMQSRFNNNNSEMKQISSNMYQIYTYVNNFKSINVNGMILYAKTNNELQPDHIYKINGHKIIVKNINLNQHFSEIKRDLLKYADNFIN